MAIVSFTLDEESVVAFQNVLACILRFSEDVSFDTKKDKLVLSALNSTKSAFVSFTFSASHFSRYKYEGTAIFSENFYCVIYIRALLSIFRSRAGSDISKGANAESRIERCDVSVHDGPGKKSRIVAKIAWRNGITATHAIPFEAKPPMYATFNKSRASNHWSISAHTMRRLMEHFGPKVELLDINTEGNQVVCFTEKQDAKTDGSLNMNLHTSITVKMDEFDFIDVEDDHHILIDVKDLRAVLQHACTTSSSIQASYSEPWRPLKFSYDENGMLCDFILGTSGNKANLEAIKQKARTKVSSKARPALETASVITSFPSSTADTRRTAEFPVMSNDSKPYSPSTHLSHPGLFASDHSDFEIRPQLVPPPTVRAALPLDGDSQWEPVNPDEDDPGFVQIEWDESMQPELSFVPVGNSQEDQRGLQPPFADTETTGLEPTQRLTQVRGYGLFP